LPARHFDSVAVMQATQHAATGPILAASYCGCSRGAGRFCLQRSRSAST
jgi:hypothetical protein